MSREPYRSPETVHPEMRERPPMQPIVMAKDGVLRFQANRLVLYLLEEASRHGIDLNHLARVQGIPGSDREQFNQLIGYSVSGCPYLSDRAANRAAEKARSSTPGDAPPPREKR